MSVREVLQQLAPFQTLDQEILDAVSADMYFKNYPEGDYIFRQGTPSLGILFVVVEGLAEVTVAGEKGAENVVGYRRPNDFFGETVILTGGTYSGSVIAKEDLTCLLIPRSAFERIIFHDPNVAIYFSRSIIDRMRTLYEEIVAEQPYEAYGRSESALFRRRVGELMSSPVITCRPSDPVTGIAQSMTEHNISALVVVDDLGRPIGVITEKDLVKQVLAARADIDSCRADNVMNRDLVVLAPQAPLHQALMAVIKQGVKHLAVADQGMVVGIVTLVDLVKARSTGTLWVAHRIESKHTLTDLQEAGHELDLLLSALVAEKAPIPALFDIMTELHDRLTRRVITLCEEEMVYEGYGSPPQPYCWLNLGSAGRRERILRTDQDNAIVYADPPPDKADVTSAYFQHLGEKVVDGLTQCCFGRGEENVMASNPKWCRSLSDWLQTVDSWIKQGEPSGVKMLNVFLDLRPIHGDPSLAETIWNQTFQSFKESSPPSQSSTGDGIHYRAPISSRGSFITEKSGPHKGEINLKTSGLVHIANCTRIFAIMHGITETSILGRLRELSAREALDQDEADYIQAAHETITMFHTRENLRKLQQGLEPDSYINPSRLSRREQDALRDALLVIGRLQKLTNNHFNEFWRHYLMA